MRIQLLCFLILTIAWGSSGEAGTLAQFRTVFGDVEVELFEQDKPATVENFTRYVNAGLYTNMFAHRLNPGFVLQGGGFYVSNRGQTNQMLTAIPTFAPVTNEYSVGRRFSNTYGTIAMARVGGLTNSATSQWFFNLANNASLDTADGGFTVFGRVVRGTNVLEKFRTFRVGQPTNTIVNLGGPYAELPVLRTNLTYNDLIYVDVSLLKVQVRALPGVREISWNSVSNKINYLEFTPLFPPIWQSFVATNGNGSRYTVSDTNAGPRFYRVRVNY